MAKVRLAALYVIVSSVIQDVFYSLDPIFALLLAGLILVVLICATTVVSLDARRSD